MLDVPCAVNIFSPHQKRATRRSRRGRWILPSTARHPVHPPTAHKIKSCWRWASGFLSRSHSSMDAAIRTVGETLASAARILARRSAFCFSNLNFTASIVFYFCFRFCSNWARHFSTRSLILFFHALLSRFIIYFVHAEIILRDKMIFAVMRVFVADAVAQFFGAE